MNEYVIGGPGDLVGFLGEMGLIVIDEQHKFGVMQRTRLHTAIASDINYYTGNIS